LFLQAAIHLPRKAEMRQIMNFDVAINVIDEAISGGAAKPPTTGDSTPLTLLWILLGFSALAIVFCLSTKRATGKQNKFPTIFTLVLAFTLVASGTAFQSFAANDADLEITITKGELSRQSTIAIPISLHNESRAGTDITIQCPENELGQADGTLKNPKPLKDNSVGFALAASPEASENNTVVNGFSSSYKEAKNLSKDAHTFAALSTAPMTVYSFSAIKDTSVTLYLSAKASSNLKGGKYNVSISVQIISNIFVDFETNGAGDIEPLRLTPTSSGASVSAALTAAPEKPGYTFLNWNTKADGSGISKAAGSKVSLSADTTFHAIWKANRYTVKFNANGGSVTPAEKTVIFSDTYGELPTPTRQNNSFLGWFTQQVGGDEITAATPVTIPVNRELFAHWAPISTVTFNANEGSVNSETAKTVTYGQTYGILPDAERTGHTFDGWFTGQTDGAKIEASTTVAITTAQMLYAHWTANTYTVSFDTRLNFVENPESITVTYGEDYGTLPPPNYNGLLFIGWCPYNPQNELFDLPQITATTKVTITADQTLYAIWMEEP
jgi:uncharacterized repeat protein (TIGR02543 family)